MTKSGPDALALYTSGGALPGAPRSERLCACPPGRPALVLASRTVTCRYGGGARALMPRRLRAAGYRAGPAGKCGRVFSRLRHQPGLGPVPGPPGHGLPKCAGRRPHLQSLGRRRGDGRYGSRPGRRGVACEDSPRDRGGPRRRGQLSAERVPAPAALDGPPGCAQSRGPGRSRDGGEEKAEGKESLV